MDFLRLTGVNSRPMYGSLVSTQAEEMSHCAASKAIPMRNAIYTITQI